MTQRETHVENNVTPTTAAINSLRDYLTSIGHADANIYLKQNMVYVEFPKKVELTSEQFEKIGSIFYWTDSLHVPYINGLVHFYEFADTLLISVNFYDKIFMVHEYMISKKVKLLEFDVCNFEFSFKYDCSMQEDFNEEALKDIKELVDPKDEQRRAVALYEIKNMEHCFTMSVRT